jgi:hypothetical protein
LREKLEGAVITADEAPELEEVQGLLASARERGFVVAASVRLAVEEADLSTDQTRDLFSYFEEHAIEIVDSDSEEPGGELQTAGEGLAPVAASAAPPLSGREQDGETGDRLSVHTHVRDARESPRVSVDAPHAVGLRANSGY